MIIQDKCTIYRYTAGCGYYYLIEVQENGFCEVYIYHGKILLPMFIFGIALSKHTNMNKILEMIEARDKLSKENYPGYIKSTRLHYIDF